MGVSPISLPFARSVVCGLLLAGIAATAAFAAPSDQNAGATSTTAAPAVAAPARAAPAIQPALADLVSERVMVADHTLRADAVFAVNPDCSPADIVTVRIVNPPGHGSVEVMQIADFPHYPAANPRSACNSRKITGVGIFYTPAAGYTGTDGFTARMIYGIGVARNSIFRISIE